MRPLRIEFPGAYYHVINRGLEKRSLFNDGEDFSHFLKLCKKAQGLYGFNLHSYCLMNNHYHLFLETPEPNLSRTMKYINGLYAQYFNHKYDRVGPLFQGRFKSPIVESNSYVKTLTRYIHLNPVKAGLVQDPALWQWSSYSSYIHGTPDDLLSKDFVLSHYSGLEELKKHTVSNDSTDEAEFFENSILIGSDGFRKKIISEAGKLCSEWLSYDIASRQAWLNEVKAVMS